MAPQGRGLVRVVRGCWAHARSSNQSGGGIDGGAPIPPAYINPTPLVAGPSVSTLVSGPIHRGVANRPQQENTSGQALSGKVDCGQSSCPNPTSGQVAMWRPALPGPLPKSSHPMAASRSLREAMAPVPGVIVRWAHQNLQPSEAPDEADRQHSMSHPSSTLQEPAHSPPKADSSSLKETAAAAAAADILKTTAQTGDCLNIDDAQALFSELTTGELAHALLNLEIAANELLVDVGTAVLRSPLMKSKICSYPVLAAVKHTAYSHFCAGETVEEAAHTLERMWQLGLRGILDFSVEDAHDRETCEKNLEGFLRTIRQAEALPKGSVSFACVKVTALCPLRTLERASEVLRWRHLDPSYPVPWLFPSLPVLAQESPTFYVKGTPEPLDPEEERQVAEAYGRLKAICEACQEQGLPLLIDAEYTTVEPIIDHLAYAAAVEYNRGRSPLVYATVQCYLKDALPRLGLALEAAQKLGIPYGVKLVRGAYLTRETKLAKELGAVSPIHASIEDTHQCYDACAAVMLEAAARPGTSSASVVLATHNYGSGRAAVLKAEELGVRKADPQLHFAQLKGMADGLSLGLALAGYNVSKYLPYGPVTEVMPYLIRRAEENRGLIGNTGADRKRIRKELGRRLRAAIGLA